MTQDQPSRLDRIEALLADTADLVLAHDEALARIEEQTNRNARAIEALTTSTTETLRLVADNSRRIEQILEYLFRERPNGRGDAGQ
ncbi:hypothetical protein SD81_032660 [Tolypothrix campylonemoides VB511288]|nr:hypothetical protein SD81_032660 [Tolypothrix campylonemoides VB511288]